MKIDLTDKLALRCLEGFPLCIKRHFTRTLLGAGLQITEREEITVQLYRLNTNFLSLNNVEKNKSRAKIIFRDRCVRNITWLKDLFKNCLFQYS